MCAIRSVLRGARHDHVHGGARRSVETRATILLTLSYRASQDFFFPSGWGAQLRCASENCFTGPSAMTDLLIFTSVPVVLKQFGTILEVTLNSGTGRRFAGNFAYDAGAGVADLLQSFYPSAALADCTACFKCRFPEIRLIWWIVASTLSIASPSSFGSFRGNVTEHCMGARLDALTCATSPRLTRPGERSGRRAVRVWWRCPSRPG